MGHCRGVSDVGISATSESYLNSKHSLMYSNYLIIKCERLLRGNIGWCQSVRREDWMDGLLARERKGMFPSSISRLTGLCLRGAQVKTMIQNTCAAVTGGASGGKEKKDSDTEQCMLLTH